MDIKNILVPTDFSTCSETAVSFAIEFALATKARLFLMHSVSSSFSVASERLTEQLMSDDRFREIEAQTVTEVGDPGQAILRQAEEKQADLILIGNKGSSGGRRLLGSTAIEVLSKAKVPVLSVPEKSTYAGFEDILFMTDFNNGDVSALEDIQSWATDFNAHLHVLHVFTDDNFKELIKYRGFREIVEERLKDKKISFQRVFNQSFYGGLLDYMKTRSVNLITLTRYQKNIFQKIMERDHTREVSYEIETPFMVLNGDQYL